MKPKKILAVIFAVMMVMACSVSVFADGSVQVSDSGKGTVVYHSKLHLTGDDWNRAYYNVDLGSCTVLSAEDVFGLPSPVTINGQVFKCWELQASGGGYNKYINPGETFPISSTYPNQQLYAVWEDASSNPTPESIDYTLTYDGNIAPIGEDDIVENIPSDTAKYQKGNEAVISTQLPTNKYRTFLGWSTNKAAETPDAGLEAGAENAKVTFDESNIMLYAVWQMNEQQQQYKVTYVLDPVLADNYVLKNNNLVEYTVYKSINQRITDFGVWAKKIDTQEEDMDVTMTLLNDCKGINGGKEFNYGAGTVISVRESAAVIKVNYNTDGAGKGFGFCNWENDSEIRIKVSLTPSTDPIDPVDPIVPVDPVVPIDPVDPIVPVNPIVPIVPIDPVDPVNPVEPAPLPDDEYMEDPEDAADADREELPEDELLIVDNEDNDNPDQPKTGDAQNLAMWISILLAAIAGLGTLLANKLNAKTKR